MASAGDATIQIVGFGVLAVNGSTQAKMRMLRVMAANGSMQAKIEKTPCDGSEWLHKSKIEKSLREGSKWLRMSKMIMPQCPVRWQQIAVRKQKGKCIGAMAENGLSRISNNQNSAGLRTMTANGPVYVLA